jgi:hypothetical protein
MKKNKQVCEAVTCAGPTLSVLLWSPRGWCDGGLTIASCWPSRADNDPTTTEPSFRPPSRLVQMVSAPNRAALHHAVPCCTAPWQATACASVEAGPGHVRARRTKPSRVELSAAAGWVVLCESCHAAPC